MDRILTRAASPLFDEELHVSVVGGSGSLLVTPPSGSNYSTEGNAMSLVTSNATLRWGTRGDEHEAIGEMLDQLNPLRLTIVNHRMYRELDTQAKVQTFMEHHVFAVLDFMWLLKALQRALTCVDVPWIPVGRGATRRFINELVIAEESDASGDTFVSHFELYLQAMAEAGADTVPITQFVASLRAGRDPLSALDACHAPLPARRFLRTTWGLIQGGQSHELAGAFALGRENLIPAMFTSVMGLSTRMPGQFTTFVDYLERHIQLDEEEHTPMAFGMLTELCGEEDSRWDEALRAAETSLLARVDLWDGAVQQMLR
jgi:hypothetical protein